MNEKNIKMNGNETVNGDNIVIGNFDETAETTIPEFSLSDYTNAIERFQRIGVEVKYAGFNLLNRFTIITAKHFTEVTYGSMSVHVPAARLAEFYDKAIEMLGQTLIKKIVQVSADGGQFSQHRDLNAEIPREEVNARITRLVKFMNKIGYEKGFHSFEWERFESKFPKYYLDYMIRCILEGNTGVLKCASCTHATFIEGGFLRCDDGRMQEVDTSDGIPDRLNHATTQRVWFGKIDCNIISQPEKMHDCWRYQRSTKTAAIKKAAEANK